MSTDSKSRRKIDSVLKISILRKLLVDGVPMSELCDEHSLQPTQVYTWQRQLFAQGETIFERSIQKSRTKQNQYEKKIANLEKTIQDRNEVVAELLQEHVQLKKANGAP